MSRSINHILFRHGGGFPTKSAENKEAYYQNASDFKRDWCGTICGKSISGETARAAKCLILNSKAAQKSPYVQLKDGF